MKTFKFNTAIKNKQDFEKLKSYLSGIEGIVSCSCENDSSVNLITVKTEGISQDTVSRKIFKAGFRNEPFVSGWKKAVGNLFKKDCCK